MKIDKSMLVTKDTIAEKQRQETIDAIAKRRFDAEVAGVTVQGVGVHTDRTTQMKLTAATLRALRDATYTVEWKTTSGSFITLDSEAISGLADVVGDYVQACYTRESELVNALNAGEFNPEMLESGWPSKVL